MQYHHKKSLSLPRRNPPRLLPLPSPSISPQGSQPISQPIPLAILRKAPNLSPQRRGSLPTSLPSAPKGNSPIRSSITARQYPSEAESTASPPSPRSLSRLAIDPLQTLTNSPPFDPHPNEQNERRNHPALYPPTNAPFPEYFLPVYEPPTSTPSAPPKTTLR